MHNWVRRDDDSLFRAVLTDSTPDALSLDTEGLAGQHTPCTEGPGFAEKGASTSHELLFLHLALLLSVRERRV